MIKIVKVFVLLIGCLFLYIGCQPEIVQESLIETASPEGLISRPTAPTGPYCNASAIVNFYANAPVRDFSIEQGLYFYFVQPGLVSKYNMLAPYGFVKSINIDTNYIDASQTSLGLVAASNSARRFYTNLMESNYFYYSYPADISEIFGLSVYSDGTYNHIVVIAKFAGINTRYLVDYIFYNYSFYRRSVVALATTDHSDITMVSTAVYGGRNADYPIMWKRSSATAVQVLEKLPSGYNCHGYFSNYTQKYEILYNLRVDYSYRSSTNEWGFYNLNYFTNTNTVEISFLPFSGVRF